MSIQTAPITTPERWMRPLGGRSEFCTERLVLRPWRASDADAAFALVESCREHLRRWMSWVDDARDLRSCRATIERLAACHRDEVPEQLAYAVLDRQTGEPVGGVGLHSFRPEIGQAQLGYWIEPMRRGSRLGQEAVRALIDHAFAVPEAGGLGLRRLEVRCAACNDASRSVAEWLGLRREGVLRAERWVEDVGWDDSLIFGVLAEEWALGAA